MPLTDLDVDFSIEGTLGITKDQENLLLIKKTAQEICTDPH